MKISLGGISAHPKTRGFFFVFVLVVLNTGSMAQDPTSEAQETNCKGTTEDKEACEVSKNLWNTILVPCGKDFYYAGSNLDVWGPELESPGQAATTLIGYGDVRFPLPKKYAITEADSRNGILWKGSAEANAQVWRVRDLTENSWSKWAGPGQTLPADLVNLRNILAGKGIPGSLRVDMEKTQDGGWFYISALARIPVKELRARHVSCYAIQQNGNAPPPEASAHTTFLAKDNIPFVPLSPAKAATVQMGVYEDYTQAFKAVLPDKMLPPGSKVTPVLDIENPAVVVADDLRKHFVIGALGSGVPISFASGYNNGPDYIAVLVRLEDGQFGMIPGALFTHPDIFKPASDVHAPVPLSIQSREFTGTADEFSKVFPDFVARAAVAAGLDPRQYDKETALILAAVKTCAQITPQAAARVTDQNGNEMLERIGNGEYAVCNSGQHSPFYTTASDKVKTWDSQKERGLMFAIHVRGQGWRHGQGFAVEVDFTPLKGDETVKGSNMFATIFDNYGVVHAEIRAK